LLRSPRPLRPPGSRSAVLAAAAVALAVALLAGACAREEQPAGPAAAAAPAEAGQLNVFIWSEYIDPEIVSDFEREFDCKVTVDLYEDNESMMAKLQGGGVSLYDLVVPSDYIVPAMLELGLLAPLRRENIPNLANLDSQFANPSFDPGNQYTAPYQWGTVGIYVRQPAGQAVDQTWGLIFDPALQPGPFLMMDSSREMMGAALKYRGYSLNSTDPAELTEVRDLLLEAKARSQGFEGGVGGKNKVLAKTVTAAVVYNGDAARGMAEDAETVYFVPREGGEIWMDSMAIPAQAPHRDLAETFINYILDPAVGAKLSNFNQYPTPNRAALPMIDPADLANPAIYPPAEVMTKLELIRDLGADARLYDEIWTQVKSQ
jgi:spermidine/putrescine transport system substrate-binding protein